jgi:hypothetical protein
LYPDFERPVRKAEESRSSLLAISSQRILQEKKERMASTGDDAVEEVVEEKVGEEEPPAPSGVAALRGWLANVADDATSKQKSLEVPKRSWMKPTPPKLDPASDAVEGTHKKPDLEQPVTNAIAITEDVPASTEETAPDTDKGTEKPRLDDNIDAEQSVFGTLVDTVGETDRSQSADGNAHTGTADEVEPMVEEEGVDELGEFEPDLNQPVTDTTTIIEDVAASKEETAPDTDGGTEKSRLDEDIDIEQAVLGTPVNTVGETDRSQSAGGDVHTGTAVEVEPMVEAEGVDESGEFKGAEKISDDQELTPGDRGAMEAVEDPRNTPHDTDEVNGQNPAKASDDEDEVLEEIFDEADDSEVLEDEERIEKADDVYEPVETGDDDEREPEPDSEGNDALDSQSPGEPDALGSDASGSAEAPAPSPGTSSSDQTSKESGSEANAPAPSTSSSDQTSGDTSTNESPTHVALDTENAPVPSYTPVPMPPETVDGEYKEDEEEAIEYVGDDEEAREYVDDKAAVEHAGSNGELVEAAVTMGGHFDDKEDEGEIEANEVSEDEVEDIEAEEETEEVGKIQGKAGKEADDGPDEGFHDEHVEEEIVYEECPEEEEIIEEEETIEEEFTDEPIEPLDDQKQKQTAIIPYGGVGDVENQLSSYETPIMKVEKSGGDDSGELFLYGCMCLLFFLLIVLAVLLILAFVTETIWQVNDDTGFVGLLPTTPLDPFQEGNCNLEGQVQPHVLSQCQCTETISSLADDTQIKYASLRDKWIVPNVYSSWNLPPESCEPANKALLWLATVNSQDDIDLLQRYVLAFLYFSTEGPEWSAQENWIQDVNVCTWYGVECSDEKLVDFVNLNRNELSGPVSILQQAIYCVKKNLALTLEIILTPSMCRFPES